MERIDDARGVEIEVQRRFDELRVARAVVSGVPITHDLARFFIGSFLDNDPPTFRAEVYLQPDGLMLWAWWDVVAEGDPRGRGRRTRLPPSSVLPLLE